MTFFSSYFILDALSCAENPSLIEAELSPSVRFTNLERSGLFAFSAKTNELQNRSEINMCHLISTSLENNESNAESSALRIQYKKKRATI